ncbi:type 2 isopentenyl-diphosphate Delta-isomerase [PVC group bacterium]|nr:type 2 isopentenyl-diphosphate Delta-isomerase [PVC group bacterium]
MSTSSANKNLNSSGTSDQLDISDRKQSHLDICHTDAASIQSGIVSGFEEVHFIHDALPELSMEDIDSSCEFLGQRVSLPLFISCMTGGSAQGMTANRKLAEAAEAKNIPVGLGSIRVLLEQENLFEHFHIKPYAPHVPILANIGAVQVRGNDNTKLYKLLEKLQAHALVIHLNPGQELFQPGGDTDFRGLLGAIQQTVKTCPLPVIVKETGFGIRPHQIKTLLNMGVKYVDIAGAGGTNWVLVEAQRLNKNEEQLANEFTDWGLPTAYVLDSVGSLSGRVLASGGLKSGMDLMKSIALGSKMGGLAGIFIRDVLSGGVEAVIRRIEGIEKVIRSVMLLTSSKTLKDVTANKIWRETSFISNVEQIKKAEGM